MRVVNCKLKQILVRKIDKCKVLLLIANSSSNRRNSFALYRVTLLSAGYVYIRNVKNGTYVNE